MVHQGYSSVKNMTIFSNTVTPTVLALDLLVVRIA